MRFSCGIGLYPRAEGDLTSEPHHRSGEGAMEAPYSRGSHLRIGKSYAGCISNSISGNSEDEE